MKKTFRRIQKNNLFQVVQKLVSGNHMMYIQKEHAQPTPYIQTPQIEHSCDLPLLACLPILSSIRVPE